MKQLLGVMIVFLSAGGAAMATPIQAPEIDASTATSAVALVSGGLMVLRSRHQK